MLIIFVPSVHVTDILDLPLIQLVKTHGFLTFENSATFTYVNAIVLLALIPSIISMNNHLQMF